MSKNQAYADQYAEAAMEQMKRYGIPASVTLAQGILESSNGESELSRLGNNHFGIKATASWLKNGVNIWYIRMISPMKSFVSTVLWQTATSTIPSSSQTISVMPSAFSCHQMTIRVGLKG